MAEKAGALSGTFGMSGHFEMSSRSGMFNALAPDGDSIISVSASPLSSGEELALRVSLSLRAFSGSRLAVSVVLFRDDKEADARIKVISLNIYKNNAEDICSGEKPSDSVGSERASDEKSSRFHTKKKTREMEAVIPGDDICERCYICFELHDKLKPPKMGKPEKEQYKKESAYTVSVFASDDAEHRYCTKQSLDIPRVMRLDYSATEHDYSDFVSYAFTLPDDCRKPALSAKFKGFYALYAVFDNREPSEGDAETEVKTKSHCLRCALFSGIRNNANAPVLIYKNPALKRPLRIYPESTPAPFFIFGGWFDNESIGQIESSLAISHLIMRPLRYEAQVEAYKKRVSKKKRVKASSSTDKIIISDNAERLPAGAYLILPEIELLPSENGRVLLFNGKKLPAASIYYKSNQLKLISSAKALSKKRRVKGICLDLSRCDALGFEIAPAVLKRHGFDVSPAAKAPDFKYSPAELDALSLTRCAVIAAFLKRLREACPKTKFCLKYSRESYEEYALEPQLWLRDGLLDDVYQTKID